VDLDDRRLAQIVRQCHHLPGHHLFEYIGKEGKPRPLTSTAVNQYLHEVTGQYLTAKDFRTWAGTVECAIDRD
jgi:DNA topoisomerase-1